MLVRVGVFWFSYTGTLFLGVQDYLGLSYSHDIYNESDSDRDKNLTCQNRAPVTSNKLLPVIVSKSDSICLRGNELNWCLH